MTEEETEQAQWESDCKYVKYLHWDLHLARSEVYQRLRAEGWSIQRMADATGYSRATVSRVLREQGGSP